MDAFLYRFCIAYIPIGEEGMREGFMHKRFFWGEKIRGGIMGIMGMGFYPRFAGGEGGV